MSHHNVRVENKKTTGSYDEKKKGFENMMRVFKRACDDSGVKEEWYRHAYYEKPSERKRRKRKESIRERQRNTNPSF